MSRIYVTQFGASWSLTPEAWLRACSMGVAGDQWDWDDLGRRLKRQRSRWEHSHKTLDWDLEDWEDAWENARNDHMPVE